MRHPQEKLDGLFEEAKRWAVVWGLSRLLRDVTVDFSDQLGWKAGACDLRTMTVTLNGLLLLDENEALLHETLCHELAHIVASLRHGCGIEQHGPEWSAYMVKVGFEARGTIALSELYRTG